MNVEFSSKAFEIGEDSIKLQLWDTAGQEKYKGVTKSYYRKSFGVLIVFDITRSESFLHVTEWLKSAKECVDKNATIVLVGNKSDLKDERVISFTEAARFCQENGLQYYECSAFNGEGVEEIFLSASKSILRKVNEGIIEIENKPYKSIVISSEDPRPNESQRCNYC